ncbi:MAG: S1/P1 nuclease [Pseudomonadota bacterium]
MIKLRKIILLVCLAFPLSASAWNTAVHKIIAEIAYENLTSTAKHHVNTLVSALRKVEPQVKTFQQLSAWPDILRIQGVEAFNSWHFVNQPFSTDGQALPPLAKHNAIWAIQQSWSVLSNKQSNTFMRAWFLAFYVHILGDIHQPLHASTRVSKAYPDGDKGGNFFPIRYGNIKNLHKLWDAAVGAIPTGAISKEKVIKTARELQKKYPKSFFGQQKITDTNPQHWADESLTIAKTFVYNTPVDKRPSKTYINKGQSIALQRVTLAGYRLAYMLNKLFTS